MFCETEVACGFWHPVRVHNEPPLWGHTREESEAELNHHLKHLWHHIKLAIRGEMELKEGTNARDLIALSNKEDVETH